MENNTKIAIGLAAAVVVGYIVYKSKNPKSTTSSGKCTGEFAVECNDGSCDVGNGDSLPCLGKRGGVKGGANYNTGTLSSIAMSTPTSDYQEVYNDGNVGSNNWNLSNLSEIGFYLPRDIQKPVREESRPRTQAEEEEMMRIIQNTSPNAYGY